MQSLTGIVAFVRTAQLKSFAAAARQLGVSPSAVGKSVARLEDHLGLRLLNRTTRSISLTPEGALFFEHCVRILEQLTEAENVVASGQATPRGRLRVDLPVTLGRVAIVPALPAFTQSYTELELDISFNDRLVDPIEEGVDVVVRIGEVPDSRLIARRLGRQGLVTCAAPAYLERFGIPQHPHELRSHECLRYKHPSSGRHRLWRFRVAERDSEIAASGRFSFSDGEALVQAAVCGLGIVQVPDYMAQTQLQQGRLQPLLDAYRPPETPISVLWPSNRHLSPKVRAFVDFLLNITKTSFFPKF